VSALRQVKAGGAGGAQAGAMNEEAIREVLSATVSCTGPSDAPHPPVELRPRRERVVRCPVCDRGFRRADPSETLGPAAWPREE
jgi:uncharacterized Zn-finger protein